MLLKREDSMQKARMRKEAAKNPRADRAQAERAIATVEKIRQLGMRSAGYRIDHPFGGQSKISKPLKRHRLQNEAD